MSGPDLFKKEIMASRKDALIIIDEVQRLPRLLDDVHYFLSQTDNKRLFVLSGSSARKLRRSSINLLAGRASQRYFYPLTGAEYGWGKPIEDILQYGTLPEVLKLRKKEDKVDFLESYAQTYLREEIQQEAVTKNMNSFYRFLEVASICNGQTVNFSSISRDAGVQRTTLKNYFQILSDTLIGHWLPPWKPRMRIKEVGWSKFYLFDTGIVRALSGKVRQPISEQERGFLLETYILHELSMWNQIHNLGTHIYFWNTHNHAEIDFVLERGDKRIGIEVKSSWVWKKEFGKHLNKAKEEKVIQKALGVYLGENCTSSWSYSGLSVLWVFETACKK